MVVVLPAPFGPSRAKTSPLLHLEGDVVHCVEVAVALAQVLNRDCHHTMRPPWGTHRDALPAHHDPIVGAHQGGETTESTYLRTT